MDQYCWKWGQLASTLAQPINPTRGKRNQLLFLAYNDKVSTINNRFNKINKLFTCCWICFSLWSRHFAWTRVCIGNFEEVIVELELLSWVHFYNCWKICQLVHRASSQVGIKYHSHEKKNIAKGTTDPGIDCIDSFRIFCKFCMLGTFWIYSAYLAYSVYFVYSAKFAHSSYSAHTAYFAYSE